MGSARRHFARQCGERHHGGAVGAVVSSQIIRGMADIAGLAQQAHDTLMGGRGTSKVIGPLMSRNIALRREMYGDASIGATNIRLTTLAEEVGAFAKFPGSGGAAIGYACAVRAWYGSWLVVVFAFFVFLSGLIMWRNGGPAVWLHCHDMVVVGWDLCSNPKRLCGVVCVECAPG